MNKKYVIILFFCNLIYFQISAQNEYKLLKNFPDEYLIYSQEDYFILGFFSLIKDYKVAFIGGEKGAFSVLLNSENLVSDTLKIKQEYLQVTALLGLDEENYLATTNVGLLSFTIVNSKISNLKVVTPKENRYDLASMNEKIIYMKPKDVIRNKLKWRILSEDTDEIIHESDSKFKGFKNVHLPNVWNRMYYIDSVFVFNDPSNNKILTYNPLNDHVKSIKYSTPEDELGFLYYDAAYKKTYLVGFNQDAKNYKIYQFNLLTPDHSFLLKTINHPYPPKSIHDNAVFVEDVFMESDKNCIVRIPLD